MPSPGGFASPGSMLIAPAARFKYFEIVEQFNLSDMNE
jgi:hypothetical protein